MASSLEKRGPYSPHARHGSWETRDMWATVIALGLPRPDPPPLSPGTLAGFLMPSREKSKEACVSGWFFHCRAARPTCDPVTFWDSPKPERTVIGGQPPVGGGGTPEQLTMAAGSGAVLLSQTEGLRVVRMCFWGLGQGSLLLGVLPHHCGSGLPLSAGAY